RWIAERFRRAVAAVEPDLMRSVSVREGYPVVPRQLKAAGRAGDSHDLGPWHAIRIELGVPRGIKRVGPVDAFAVAADLDHLWAACVRLAARMGRAANDAARVNRARELRLPRLGDVVLTHLTGSPAGDIKELVIHGEVDVGHQRRHRAKSLQQGRQLVLGRRLWQDRRRLFDVELAVFAPPGPNRAFQVRGVDYD